MKKLIIISLLLFLPFNARADLWGADLPMLAEIVFNTLHTMMELQEQTQHMNDELDGIKDRINRIRTIADIVQPSSWDQWRNPAEALRRLQAIYETMPKEYRSEKSVLVEDEISKAMTMVSKVSVDANTNFRSGKELEQRGADASPGVAQKLTASGIGTLIKLESQTQVIQSHITSLLAQMLADANERETRSVVTKGKGYKALSDNLSQSDNRFSSLALSFKSAP